MKILVTGGAGFIGSHLCEKLLQEDHTVLNIDNFNDYYDPKIKNKNIESASKNYRYHLYKGDIRDYDFLETLFSHQKIDLIIHLAAMAGVRPSIEQPLYYSDVNINGTMNLLEMAKNYGIRKFIFASSSSVYGNNKKVPFAESDNVDFPISPYAATKKADELICHTYHSLYNISMIGLRFFTVYGPRQRPDLAIHKFARRIIDDIPIQVYGDGTTQRDYTFIDDIIDGVMRSIDYVNENSCYEIFNLGESQTITLKKMIETIEDALGKKAIKEVMPMQPGDVDRTFADISKSKKILNYNPQTKFEDGIKVFIDWLNKQEK